MKTLACILGLAALAVTLGAPVAFHFGWVGLDPMKTSLLVAAIVWFVTAPVWMRGGDE